MNLLTRKAPAAFFYLFIFCLPLSLHAQSPAKNVPVTGVSLLSKVVYINELGIFSLTATVLPANATNQTVIWESKDPSIVSVDASGMLVAVREGFTEIVARTVDGGFMDYCFVSVLNPVKDPSISVSSINLSAYEVAPYEKDTFRLTATVFPANATNRLVIWRSSDPTIAMVNSSGLVTALRKGFTRITVTTEDDLCTNVCMVSVQPLIATTSISLSEKRRTVYEMDTFRLTAVVMPENASHRTVLWQSSDPAIATVDAYGLVTARRKGVARVIAISMDDNAVTDECIVTVDRIDVVGVSFPDRQVTVYERDTFRLDVTFFPADATYKTVTWRSSDPTVVTVDTSGLMIALREGLVEITVTTPDGDFTDVCLVMVKIPTVTGIRLSYNQLNLLIENTFRLIATFIPENAIDPTITRIWQSSDPTIATVDSSGLITALREGFVRITVTIEDGNYTAACIVTINKTRVVGIRLSTEQLTLHEREIFRLYATVNPADATDQTLTWQSSNSTVATVDASGLVTARQGGVAEIWVTTTDGGFKSVCTIMVLSAIKVRISHKQLTLREKETFRLTATVASKDAADQAVTWQSSNPAVATVDSSGVITTLQEGVAEITVITADGNTDACVVTVKKPMVTDIRLSHRQLTIHRKDLFHLTATTASAEEAGLLILWQSSDYTVATVDAYGTITPLKLGTVNITVTAENGSTDVCYITITDPKLTLLSNSSDYGRVESTVRNEFNDQLQLIASPADGYHFEKWINQSGEFLSDQSLYAINLTRDTTIIGVFRENNDGTLHVSSNNNFYGTVKTVHNSNGSVTITAMPLNSLLYRFVNWTISSSRTVAENPYTFPANGDITLAIANFAHKDSYNITALSSSPNHGAVFVVGGSDNTLYEGNLVRLEAFAFYGYHLMHWANEKGEAVSEDPIFTFPATADEVLTAVFAPDIFTVSVSTSDTEYGSAKAKGIYANKEQIELTATPFAGHAFVKWTTGDGDFLSLDNPHRFILLGDRSFVAYFVRNIYNVSAVATVGGRADGGGEYEFKSSVKLTAVADSGYHFTRWTDLNGALVSDSPEYIFELGAESIAYQAHFEEGETGNERLLPTEARIYYADGVLHVVNLENHLITVASISGQKVLQFKADSADELYPATLPAGICILTASPAPSERGRHISGGNIGGRVVKFIVR
ncbi:Kappa-carrageenase precursor [Bacteroidales bacterium Barb4]|nr:Kappa-carrageenase precursor [Bacteroidales bacterium Barb4]